jgi:hypothetical protein
MITGIFLAVFILGVTFYAGYVIGRIKFDD